MAAAVTIIGEGGRAGAYVLRIALRRPTRLAFGRYAGGMEFELSAGDYLYVGSARGTRGASSLPHRLLRHATRAAGPAHPLRERLTSELVDAGMGARPPERKRLRWHVDYLLERPATEMSAVFVVRTEREMERELVERIRELPGVTVPVRGLGASDHPGSTHLLRAETGVWLQARRAAERLLANLHH